MHKKGKKIDGANAQRVEVLFTNQTYTLSHYGSVCSIGSPQKGFWYGQLFLLSQYCASPFLRITAIFSPLINPFPPPNAK